MLSLFFPNADAFRLALASGIIPGDVADAEVAAAPGPGGFWVRSRAALSKDAFAALAHIGVRPFASPAESVFRQYPCWPAALPLKRCDEQSVDAPVLFELSPTRLANFLGELARCGSPIDGFQLTADAAFVRSARAPEYWIERSRTEPDSAIRSYRLAATNFWVESGWMHSLAPSAGDSRATLVSVTEGWRRFDLDPWHAPREVFALRLAPACACPTMPLARIEIALRLKPRTTGDEIDSLWIHPGSLADVRGPLESIDPRAGRRLEIAQLWSADGACIALRTTGSRPDFAPAGSWISFAAHPRWKQLWIPSNRELAPVVRDAVLLRELRIQPGEMAWLESAGNSVRGNRFPTAAFRPLAEVIRYTAPAALAIHRARPSETPFALTGFVAIPEPGPGSMSSGAVPMYRPPPAPAGPGETARSRFFKWAGRLFAPSRDTSIADEIEPDEPVETHGVPRRTRLSQQERLARRAELQELLFRRDATARNAEWAELAELFAEGGHPADAVLCWLHAIWGMAKPPEDWLQSWAKLETRGAKTTPLRGRLVERIRLAHAPAAQVAVTPGIDPRAASAELDRAEDELPCRMVWLARTALADLAGGDALQLARCRDRLFARLQNETALAALDTPSFLRFRGLSGSDRFPLARDWLVRCREPIQRWLKRQATDDRPAWAASDADRTCTACYADGMLAWGFAKLGDRGRANELGDAASAAPHPDAVTGVHRRLQEYFRGEIQLALGAQLDSSNADGAPLDELGEYAVAKLSAHSQILGRRRGRSEFGGRPLFALMGDDDLGRSLIRLLEANATPDGSTVRSLLDAVKSDRTAGSLPRVILALLEVVRAPEAVAEVLALTPLALELLPEALRLRGIVETDSPGYSIRLAARAVEVVGASAVEFDHPDSLRALLTSLSRALEENDPTAREIFRLTAPRLFRALSRCGLTAELRPLLARWYRVGADDPEMQLCAAIGWFALGEVERGNRILNDARERLFVVGLSNERDRTRIALAYAHALAHAPPRLALGRLEELFQRLGPIAAGGATARYYALKPLELIDTAITAVVNEEFGLGPDMRSWLDEDELRIRRRITRDLEAAIRARPI